jgi:hypothetical protein
MLHPAASCADLRRRLCSKPEARQGSTCVIAGRRLFFKNAPDTAAASLPCPEAPHTVNID